MKVPITDPMRVAPAPLNLPARGAQAESGFSDVEHAGNEIGQGFAEVGQAYERHKSAFEAKDASDGMTQFIKAKADADYGTPGAPKGPTDVDIAAGPDAKVVNVGVPQSGYSQAIADREAGGFQGGFLATKGDSALPAMDTYLQSLTDKRKEIRGNLKSDGARELFDKATTGLMTQAYTEAHAHVARQLEVAKQDSLKAMLAESLRVVSMDPTNDAQANTLVAQTAGAAVAMATSQKDAEAKIDAVRAEVADTRIRTILSGDEPDYQKAEDVLKQSRHALGEKALPLQASIDKHKEVGRIEEWVGGLSRTLTLPNGQVDEGAVWEAVAKQPGEWQKKADGIVQQKLAMARRAWDEGTKRLSRESYTMVNADGWKAFVASPLSDELNKRNPPLWDQLKNAEQRDLDRLERLQRIRQNSRSAIREQNDIDAAAQHRWESELLKDPRGADLELFMATQGRGVSDKMATSFPNMQAKMVRQMEKGLLSMRDDFVRQTTDAADGFILARAGTRREKDAATLERADFQAAAGRAWDATSDKPDASAPSPKEMADLRDRVIRDYMRRNGSSLRPQTADAAIRNGERVVKDVVEAGKTKGSVVLPEMDFSTPMVTIFGPNGAQKSTPDTGAKLDEWLSKHGWSRQRL